MSTKSIKCPVDGRLFATQRALQQHRIEKHGAPAASGPRGKAPNSRRKKKSSSSSAVLGSASFGGGSQTATFSGSDLIASAKVGSATPQGAILLAWDINPVTLLNTRVHEFGQVFGRWRPKSLRLTCIPGAGVFTPGSYAMGWTADPKFQFGDVNDRLRRVLTLSPNLMSSFGTPRSLVIPCDTTQKWYMCRSAEGVESDHGMVVAVLAALVAGENITINFKLDWTLEFGSPEVPASLDEVEVYPDPDWIPIFTDSVSTWLGGKKLTFKHKEGGDVVPFIGLRSDMIYKPAKGVSVPYVKADKTVGKVAFVARIREVEYPNGVACFADEATAKAYVTKGTTSGILDYVDAGDYTSPSLPTFIGQSVEAYVLCDLRRSAVAQTCLAVSSAAKINMSNQRSGSPAIGVRYVAKPTADQPSCCCRWGPGEYSSFSARLAPSTQPAAMVATVPKVSDLPQTDPPSLEHLELSSGEE